ncbi:crossover junction endodeoxyribonuclease RuvC [Methanospirillum purgamenti]|uniref:Crossover junction endodeoxyribonuclease RuvC n=1 Tax=Methanospirillum hungatei TaxID=2203 RepID=A0A8F5ZGV5_METHU|nr:crossover junction endodeoxyribonuclease RuvC [Methanospirillum hungatei]QXO95024.1 crossover junction endodeoxyribonuclease RuvC [Methanospirillum hungatei]
MTTGFEPILGIDPGFARCGYGLIGKEKNYPIAHTWGCIQTTPKTGDTSIRLLTIFEGIDDLIETYKPSCLSCEKLFFSRNTTTAMQVSEARGVILLAAAKNHIPVYEYTPNQVKLAITGSGKADKKQIQMMIARLLRLSEIPQPDDAADGLSLALCHMNWMRTYR